MTDTSEPAEAEAPKTKDGRGDFFAVDSRAWLRVCQLGMNAAVAYLVQARGTGGDNRTTSWSVNAIEKYTGIGRPRAQKAVKALVDAGLVRLDRGGTKPRFYIMPAHEVPGIDIPHPSLTGEERDVLAHLKRYGGKTTLGSSKTYGLPKIHNAHRVGCSLEAKGFVRRVATHEFEVVAPPLSEEQMEADWIWLPNAIVDGVRDEAPPLERIRQSQNVAALHIFGCLYHGHALATDGGVNWRPPNGFRRGYERLKVAESGPFIVWGFKPKTEETWNATPAYAPYAVKGNERSPFWDAWNILKQAGLAGVVAHLVEADTSEAEVLHPIPVRNGEPGEKAIFQAATKAAASTITEAQGTWAVQQGAEIFAPVHSHMGNVQVVGIVRLRYRPRTKATAIWLNKADEWAEWTQRYEEIAAKAVASRQHATSRSYQG